MSLPQPGDHLVSLRTGYQHHGLYLGGHQVIHYQGVSAGIHSGQIAITTLAEFSQGRGYRIQHHSARAFNREESIDRAYSRLGEAHYSTLFNNCEHFVQWCIEDRHSSPQVNQATTALAATGSQLLKSSQGSQAITSALMGASASLASVPATSSTILSVTAISAPAWAPLAVGVAVAYGTHRLFKWLTDD